MISSDIYERSFHPRLLEIGIHLLILIFLLLKVQKTLLLSLRLLDGLGTYFPDQRSWWMIVIWVPDSSGVNVAFTFSEAQNEAKLTLIQVSLVLASKYFRVPLYFFLFLIAVFVIPDYDNFESRVVLYSHVQNASTIFAIFRGRWLNEWKTFHRAKDLDCRHSFARKSIQNTQSLFSRSGWGNSTCDVLS